MDSLVRTVLWRRGNVSASQFGNFLLNKVERRLGRLRLGSRPWEVQVEVTTRCNLSCIMCPRTTQPLNLTDMAPELVPHIAALSRTAKTTWLFGYGEPLVSPIFHRLLKVVESSNIGFFTNGLLLNVERLQRILEESNRPVSYIFFSIDAASEALFDSIRGEGVGGRVFKNLKDISLFLQRRALGVPQLAINFMAMKRNIEELPQVVEMAARLKISPVWIGHAVIHNESLCSESLVHYPELTRRCFVEARQKAQELGVELVLPEVQGIAEVPAERAALPKCYDPWKFIYIAYNGDVYPCCASRTLRMGNLYEQDFTEIWNSENYRELRASVNSNPVEVCRYCALRYHAAVAPCAERVYIWRGGVR